MPPQLEQRGVTIQTEIEYRVGQYFVLAVNVLQIDWILLMDHTQKMLARRRTKWIRDQRMRLEKDSLVEKVGKDRWKNKYGRDGGGGGKKKTRNKKKSFHEFLVAIRRRFPSRNEVVAHFLTLMNRLHFIIAIPLLHLCYSLFFKYAVDKYILTVVTDGMFDFLLSGPCLLLPVRISLVSFHLVPSFTICQYFRYI